MGIRTPRLYFDTMRRVVRELSMLRLLIGVGSDALQLSLAGGA